MLNKDTKDKIKVRCFESLLSSMFGYGQDEEYIMEEYIMNGVTIVGLNQMSDEVLIQVYEEITYEDDELLIKARLELDINTALEA